MKTNLITYIMICFVTANVFSQTTIILTPTEDASVGFHDGYSSASTNYGSSVHYSAFSQPSATSFLGENAGWGIMDFDFSSIPDGATILNAKLDLYHFGEGFSTPLPDGHYGNNKCWLARITEAWEENTVTWNTRPSLTTIHRVTLPKSTDPDEDYLDIDVTDLVQDMIDDPENSFGFCLKLKHEHPTIGLMFASTDFADSDRWPSLEITYSEDIEPKASKEIGLKSTELHVALFPNPTINYFKVQITISEEANVSWELKDIAGKSLIQQDCGTFQTGTYTLPVQLHESISGGMYLFEVIAGDKREVMKIFLK